MPYGERDLPATLYGLLERTAAKFPNSNAVSYQILSGPTDKAETLTWSQVKDKTTQAANLFRSLGIGETDVVAYVLLCLEPPWIEPTVTTAGRTGSIRRLTIVCSVVTRYAAVTIGSIARFGRAP